METKKPAKPSYIGVIPKEKQQKLWNLVAIICVINQFECCILIGCYFYSTHLYNMLLRSGYGRSQDARITWTNTAEVWGSSKFIIKVTVKSGWFRGIQLCDDFIDTFNMKWMVK